MSYVPYAASIVYGVYAIYPYVPTTIVWNYVVSPLSYRFIKQVGKMYQSKTVRDEEINDKDDEIYEVIDERIDGDGIRTRYVISKKLKSSFK